MQGSMATNRTWTLRIIYVLLLMLVSISVLPLWFYGTKIMSANQETLETQEKALQTGTSHSLAREISLYSENLEGHLNEFFSAIVPLASHIEASKYATDPRLLEVLEG